MSPHTALHRHGKARARRGHRLARLSVLAFLALGGCEHVDRDAILSKGPAFEKNAEADKTFYDTLREAGAAPVPGQVRGPETVPPTSFRATPRVRVNESVANVPADDLAAGLHGEAVSVNYNNIPLPVFINQVFGEQLGISFTMSPDIHKQQDLVTLRIVKPVTPAELFRVARTTLAAYGVVINRENGVLVFLIDRASKGGQTPLLVSGRTLPDVPDSQRPIFMFVPLEVVSNAKVKSWLSDVMKGVDLTVQEDPVRNAVVLVGKSQEVEQALSIIKSLDQPLMRGKFSMSVQPAYVPVKDLANDLERILQSEGYDASQRPPLGSVIVLPLAGSNTLIVFAPNQQILDHVRQWVDSIDQQRQIGISDGIFSYEVTTTSAEAIVDVLNSLDGGAPAQRQQKTPLRVQPSDAASAEDGMPEEARQTQGSATSQSFAGLPTEKRSRPRSSGGRFVVDANRNAVVFRGSGEEWLELLPTVRAMDRPAPAVLVEVLIAEVTLTDGEQSGVEWLAKDSMTINGNTYRLRLGTLGGLNIGDSGFNLTLDNAGETRAVLNLFYENNRAEIRSRPRLMVMSGQTARIDVGDEVPVVTSASQSVTAPDAPIVNNVQYRKTGVTLEIRPTVHSSGYVDMDIAQQLSQVRPSAKTDSGPGSNNTAALAPTIFNRAITTSVSLKDGGSILLGGLVSSRGDNQQRGVPLLGKLPYIGKLFRVDGVNEDRTELMVLVIPYVVRNPDEATEITKTLAKPG